MKINKVIILFVLVLIIIICILVERYHAVKKLELIVKDYSFFEELPNPKLTRQECYRDEGKQHECRSLLYKIEDKELFYKIKNELKDVIIPLDGNFAEKLLKENREYIIAKSKIKEEWNISIIQEEDIYNMHVF